MYVRWNMEEPDRARGRVTASRIDSWWVKRLSGHGRGKSRGKSVIKKSRRLRVSIQYADIRHISLYIVVLGGLSSPTLYTVQSTQSRFVIRSVSTDNPH